MKEIFEKYKWWFIAGAIAFIIIVAFVVGYFLDIHDSSVKENDKSQYYENLRYFITTIGGTALAFTGIGLTIWGRILIHEQNEKIQKQIDRNSKANREQTRYSQKQINQAKEQMKLSKDANASERYENAARMLGDEILAVRIAGCQALRNLGMNNKDMAAECVQLLLHFINNPHFSKTELASVEGLSNGKNFEAIFSRYEKLRADIDAANNGFSDISRFYYTKNIALKLGIIELPSYYLQNIRKGMVSLTCAIMMEGDFKDAYLYYVDLRKMAFLNINFLNADLKKSQLQNAVFWDSNLLEAELEGADLSGTLIKDDNEKITKEQILSATWGYDKIDGQIKLSRPNLPKKLLEDEDIKKWLEKPHHNKYEKEMEEAKKSE